MSTSIKQRVFGLTPQGQEVIEYTLANKHGSLAKVINFGGVITELHVPDRNGKLSDVVLGFETLEPYLEKSPFFGALIGRVGNRIANAQFELDGETYQLNANNGPNNLHGGPQGFDKKLWRAEPFENDEGPGLTLQLLSEDGDQGFPGNLKVVVTYQLTHNNEFRVDYLATTDKATPVNLTQHTYFNLAGSGDILNHKMQIFAKYINAVNDVQIPVGLPMAVEGTPFDFLEPHFIGERINNEHPQIKNGLGYDHNFLISQTHYKAMTLAARVEEESSGRVLEVFTREPGVQFYSGNFLDGSLSGKDVNYKYRTGFCLEPQHAPDSVNQPQFPSIILHPGEEYKTQTVFKFSTL